jgi:purine catabolism regulator
LALTVREALRLGGLQKAVLVGGQAGLDKPISCVDVMEVPDLQSWFRPGEFLVTTCYSIKDDLTAQVNLVRGMVQIGGAALVVKFGRFIGSVPEEMCQLADEVGLPLISLPDEVPFIDVTHSVMTAILNEQAAELAYSEQVHRTLVKTALEMNGLPAIADKLGRLIGRTVTIYSDPELQLLREAVAETGRNELGLTSADFMRLEGDDWRGFLMVEVQGKRHSLFPVKVKGRLYGFLLVDTTVELREMDYIAIEHAVPLTALEMFKNEMLVAAQRSHRRDLLEDLISNVPHNRDIALRRAERLGFFLDEPKLILLVDVDDFTGFIRRQAERSEQLAEQLKRSLQHVTSRALEVFDKRVLVVQRSDSVVAIIPAAGLVQSGNKCGSIRKTIQPLAQAIGKRIAALHDGITVTIAVSTVIDTPELIGEHYQNLRQMMKLARKMDGPGKIVFWEDAQLYMVLGNLGGTLTGFYQSILGELDNQSIKNREELLDTLQAYFDCQGSVMEAAAKLYIHRNTLRYRLDKVKEILGRDLDSPEERFSIALALKVRRLL